jgi:uncharacterized protein
MTTIDSLNPTQDERVMAGLAHITSLVPFWGVVAPIVIWATQKDKSPYVAFQALQAVVLQLTMIIGYFIGMFIYLFFFLITFIPLIASSGSNDAPSPVFFLGFLIPFFVFFLIFLVGFVFVIYGIIGAIMAFQGKPFRYIIIGNLVERFLGKKETAVVNP